MSTDADYTSFLEKANQSTSSNPTSSSGGANTNADTHSWPDPLPSNKSISPLSIPPHLTSIRGVYYTSEIDDEFTPVSFQLQNGDAEGFDGVRSAFSKGGNENVDVQEMQVEEFDARGNYREIVEAVKKGGDGEGNGKGKGEVRVYRIGSEGSAARVWYFVLAVDEQQRVSGFRVRAVES